MSPRATTRFRQATTAVALCWAILALVVGVRAQLEQSRSPTMPFAMASAAGIHTIHAVTPVAEAAGLGPGDRLTAVDGIPTSAWLRAGGLQLSAGEPNHYRVEKPDGLRVEVPLAPIRPGKRSFPIERMLAMAIPLVGLGYLGIGFVVWRLKQGRRESWALLMFSSFTAALLFLAVPAYPLPWTLAGMTVPLVGASGWQLFTTYPIEPPWAVRHPAVRAVPWMIGGALSLGMLGAPLWPFEGAYLEPITVWFASGLALGCIGVVLHERLEQRGHPAARRADIMLMGACAAFLPVVGFLGWHATIGTTFPWTLSLLGFFLFPAAVGYGIARRELFDVRLVARSSAAHGAVTLAITGLFALLITSADAAFGRFDVDARSPAFSVVFLFFAILGFNPLRARFQDVVDRFFDRDRVAYRTAVREISEAMVSMLSAKEITDRILVAVTDTMGVDRAMVLLIEEGSETLRAEASRGDWDQEEQDFEVAPDHPIMRVLWMERRELAREDFDDEADPELREACRDVFDGLDVELLVPVLFGVDLLGVIAVGRQLIGESLGPDERQLLRTLANQSAIAIENARAFDEIAQLNKTLEARVEDRTRELRETQAQLVQSEKMRSLGQLVAGVAHELNNPIGFVHANLQLLEEYVGRLADPDPARRERAREAITKLLDRSKEGTERVKQIVADLRTFSRTGEADLQQASINEEIDRTLSLIEPRLKGGVSVERDYGELPRIHCFVGQLNQVFMNLLMNAIDAMDGRGRIKIATRAIPDGVELCFEDDGPGMPEHVRTRIFEPFFTTKPVGEGTGLGLSLSLGIIERHGGRVEVASRAGEGTRFTIRLPLEPPPDAAQAIAPADAAQAIAEPRP